ncbi:MAG TPA: DUF4157 domain-containing protein [Terracidiphilus sp.]|jgi:hypothetical protein|nr:DUF4157 domain-containing protein [Terracidiphilus sp.]
MRPESAASHSSPDAVPHQVRRVLSSPGQPLDPEFRAAIEPRFGREFGDVRVHTDSAAGESAHALEAHAYTAGNHLVFGRNRYAPETVSGRRLLIHELAHVAQQGHRPAPPEGDWRLDSASSPAEQSADAALHAIESPFALGAHVPQLAGLAPAEPILHRAVNTWGGTWDTTKYDARPTKDGIQSIELHFKPGDPVDASMIGIVQKVTSKQNSALVAVNPTVGARSLPAGSAGEGAHIDQLAQFRNPLYATGAGGAADKLWDTPAQAGDGQHGFHAHDAKGTLVQRDAILKDGPRLHGAGPNSSQIFEDTALAVTGVQTGATYGSVQWGWKTDAAGTFTKLPLTKVSDDAPSGTFKAAQSLWNKSKDSAGNDLINFYTASGKFVQTDDASLVSDPNDAAKTEIVKLPKDTRVEMINIGIWEKFNKADPKVQWWKITVTEGPSIGKTGWILSSQVGNTKAKPVP